MPLESKHITLKTIWQTEVGTVSRLPLKRVLFRRDADLLPLEGQRT